MIYDAVIIGGGQAGLSMGYYLKKGKLPFIILDSEERTGDSWRQRYDSLLLFTPKRYSSLPGLPWENDPFGLPTKDEMAEYLEQYAEKFSLPIQHNTKVDKVEMDGEIFRIATSKGTLMAKRVIAATGPFQKPAIPAFAKELGEEVVQLHSSAYKNPSQLKRGPVLVVGGGNSGTQIAAELSKDHPVYLAVGQKLKFLPLEAGGRNIFWWFDKLGLLNAPKTSRRGSWMQKQGDPIFGYELRECIKNGTAVIKGRATGTDGKNIVFEDGSFLKPENVIWATGFQPDYSWLEVPGVIGADGKPLHNRGVSRVKGLYFLGLPWQYRRGSALLQGVGRDALYLIEFINRSEGKS